MGVPSQIKSFFRHCGQPPAATHQGCRNRRMRCPTIGTWTKTDPTTTSFTSLKNICHFTPSPPPAARCVRDGHHLQPPAPPIFQYRRASLESKIEKGAQTCLPKH